MMAAQRATKASRGPANACHGATKACHVCGQCLGDEPVYARRRHLCTKCIAAPAVLTPAGCSMRYCYQCGRLEPISSFEGSQKSCRARLHMRRRRHCRARKAPRVLAKPCGAADPAGPAPPAPAAPAPQQQPALTPVPADDSAAASSQQLQLAELVAGNFVRAQQDSAADDAVDAAIDEAMLECFIESQLQLAVAAAPGAFSAQCSSLLLRQASCASSSNCSTRSWQLPLARAVPGAAGSCQLPLQQLPAPCAPGARNEFAARLERLQQQARQVQAALEGMQRLQRLRQLL